MAERRERDPLGPRWRDGALLDRPGEQGARELLRSTSVPAFGAAAAERVRRRLAAAAVPRGRMVLLRPAAVLGLVLAGAGIAVASIVIVQRFAGEKPGARVVVREVVERRNVAHAPPPAVALPPVAPAPAAAPARGAATAARATRAPAANRARRARRQEPAVIATAPAAAAPTSSLGAETSLFRAALARLRVERDPRGALELLDEYAAAYPRGSYAAEATVARIDALLAAGRAPQALVALRSLPIETLPRGQELLVTRGELAAAAGDCAAARADFDRLLAAAPGAPLAERALYGRAVCCAQAGERAAAAADFDEYLRRFPNGRYARHARAALAR